MTNHGAEERRLGDRGCHLSWVPFDCTSFPPPSSPSASSSTSHPFFCASTSSSFTSVVLPLLFFLFRHNFSSFFTLSCAIIWHTQAAMLIFQIYPIFTLFWLSAHEERDEPYLNLFCAPCPNVIFPSLLPLLLPPPPSLRDHLSSAKFTDKIEATGMKDVNTLNRKTHKHTHVKMSNLLTFQHFYLVHGAFLIFREVTVKQVATLSLPAILFVFFFTWRAWLRFDS